MKRAFTLVHRAGRSGSAYGGTGLPAKQSSIIPVGYGNRKLREALTNTYGGRALRGSTARHVNQIKKELGKAPRVTAVGVWDLETHVGFLPDIIKRLNRAQRQFTFFDVQASVPAGLVGVREYIPDWMRDQGEQLTPSEIRELTDNILDNDLFGHAERVRRDLGLHYLAGITPHLIAGVDTEGAYWNHFSSGEGRTMLVSTYDLAKYARRARVPFEAAVLTLLIAQLLAEMNPDLEFHDDRGCIFDSNEDRDAIVKSLRRPHIELQCIDLIKPTLKEPAYKMVRVLESYASAKK